MAFSWCKIQEAVAKVFDWCEDEPWPSADLDEQTLSDTVVDGATTAITISNGNTIPIVHPPPPALASDTCAVGHNERRLGFAGQVFYNSTDFNAQVLGWSPVNSTRTADCDGLAQISGGLPWLRTLVRDSFLQAYVDFQLLVNGVPTGAIWSAHDLIEHYDREVDEDNAIDYANHSSNLPSRCIPVSAGDTVGFQWRIRGRQIRPQTLAYTRLLVYRQALSVIFIPSPVVRSVSYA